MFVFYIKASLKKTGVFTQFFCYIYLIVTLQQIFRNESPAKKIRFQIKNELKFYVIGSVIDKDEFFEVTFVGNKKIKTYQKTKRTQLNICLNT